MTSLTVLGRVEFTCPCGPEQSSLLGQPKRLAVLLYLLLSRRGAGTTRDSLAAMFWPESAEDRARNALRQTLSLLRSCVGTDVISNVGTQSVRVDASLQCDAVEFESLLESDRPEAALDLYRGDLLPGFHLPGLHEFDNWLDGRRTTLRARAAKAAWDLSSLQEEAGSLADASFWGKRALALSPFSESEVQRLMLLLERVGDLAGAIRAYHGLEQSLRKELDAAPSIETRRLAATISSRIEATGSSVSALLGTRRRGVERRSAAAQFDGPERRRRERRSGSDRRAM